MSVFAEGWRGPMILRAPEGDGGGGGGAGEGGDGGGNAAPWYEAIPAGAARDHVIAKGFKDVPALAQSNYNLMQIHTGSGNVVELPKEGAKPEEMTAFYNKINGVPEAVDGYKLTFDAGVEVNEEFVGAAKTWFLEAGLRPAQAQALADKWNGFAAAQVTKAAEAQKVVNEGALTQLRQKYDAQGKGAYDQMIVNGQKAVQALKLPEDMLNRLDAANGVPANLELLAAIGAGLGGEGRFLDGGAGGGGGGGGDGPNSPEAARVEISKLTGTKDFQDSLLDRMHPMHAINTRTWRDLQVKAYGRGKK